MIGLPCGCAAGFTSGGYINAMCDEAQAIWDERMDTLLHDGVCMMYADRVPQEQRVRYLQVVERWLEHRGHLEGAWAHEVHAASWKAVATPQPGRSTVGVGRYPDSLRDAVQLEVISRLKRGVSWEEACRSLIADKRTIWGWTQADPEFGSAVEAARKWLT